MKVELFGDTDLGQVREVNEDAFQLLPAAQVMVVCDGMGGHAAGEVASREGLRVIHSYFAADPERYAEQLTFTGETPLPVGARHLVRATRLANRKIFNISQESVATRGMGTTLVAVGFENGLASICHVGDSRVYLFRDGSLERLTVDHSLAAELIANNELTEEEARHFAERNVITRALGTRPGVDVDIRLEQVKTGDIYLACSDGLCGFVEDKQMEQLLTEAKGDLSSATQSLIDAANDAGGEDNITVGLARVDDPGDQVAAEAQDVVTIKDSDGASGEVADAVLAELVAFQPPDDEDTQKVPIVEPSTEAEPASDLLTDDQPTADQPTADQPTNDQPTDDKPANDKPSGGGGRGRWTFWFLLMAAITAFVYLGGIDLLRPERSQSVESPDTVSSE